MCSVLIAIFTTTLIQATPETISITNITNGQQISGAFEIKGVVQNNGAISRVAVRMGAGPWENAIGVDRFSYMVNPQSNYGALSITVGVFDFADNQVAEKTVNVIVIPEKPVCDVISGIYHDPLNVVLKSSPESTKYYTTDGTDPKINGISYTGPIYVNQNTTIKAIAKSNNNQYSETITLDLKIAPSNLPWFMIQYYEDPALSRPLSEPIHLKTGTYYLKIVSDRKYLGGPFINIDAPSNGNDIVNAPLIPVSDCVYSYTRTVYTDFAATGDSQETITLSGTDSQGTSIQNITPMNLAAKAAFLDTAPPAQGSISLAGGISTTNDPTPRFQMNSTGASQMRLALSEADLASALWVDYAPQYDEFVISGGGIGNKSIWVEFKDRAGNIQTQHAFTNIVYDNTALSFDIEYFSDSGLIRSLGNNPYIKEGVSYLKITANQDLSSSPTVWIDAEGLNNDVSSGLSDMFNLRIFYYTRTITADNAAVGKVLEQITIRGMTPSNLDCKSAFTDTQAPGIPVVSGLTATTDLKPTWTWNPITDASIYRYRFAEDSNWTETTETSFIPDTNLTAGNSYTLYVQAGDRAGNWSASGSFSTAIQVVPEINLKQGTVDIPSQTGSYNFGDVPVFASKKAVFTIENSGTGYLNLTTTPVIQISGPNAASFSVTSQAATPVWPGQSVNFEITYSPAITGFHTATVSVANTDPDENPYTFTLTANGTIQPLTLNLWAPGNINAGESRLYSFNAVVGQRYGIVWDGASDSGMYNCNVLVSAYRQDLNTTYFSNDSYGYTSPQYITAQDDVVYIKVKGFFDTSAGSFALKVGLDEAEINVKQGGTVIPYGTGSYDFGEAAVGEYKYVTFIVQNNGVRNLNLTGTPAVQINGTDAASFSLYGAPGASVIPSSTTYFGIRFAPTTLGVKTATISIMSNDIDRNPYTFTISGTAVEAENIAPNTWTVGNIKASQEPKAYRFNAEAGKTYAVTWDDSVQGSGAYKGNIAVSAYHQEFATAYFTEVNSGYSAPMYITAVEDVVYLRVACPSTYITGSYALKIFEVAPEAVINVKDGSANLSNGGNVDFMTINFGYSSTHNLTVGNTGTICLNLSGTPRVQISGPDANCFSVTTEPSATIAPYGTTSFAIRFYPPSTGPRTATVSISNNDLDNNPFTFTLTGNVYTSPLNTWLTNNLSTPTQTQTACFETVPGSTYAITWDDRYNGSGGYTGDVRVSAYRKDLTTAYFNGIDNGYTTPQIITAQENCVVVKVTGYSQYSGAGTYRLKASLYKPIMSVRKGYIELTNGLGIGEFGSTSFSTPVSADFTISNSGSASLNLTDTPMIRITGTNADCFSVTSNPSSPVLVNGTTNFQIQFTPNSPGTKTATVSIASNDPDRNPYTFTVTGIGLGTFEPLPLETWTPGNLIPGEEIIYTVKVTPGTNYAIIWDDSGQGSGSYSGDIKVSAYQSFHLAPYFADINNGYTPPQYITAQNTTMYIKVGGISPSTTGSYSLKIGESLIKVQQGSANLPNGSSSYNFGNIVLGSTAAAPFTIQNRGSINLNLTGSPEVQISGADASCFNVTAQPGSPVGPGSSANFEVTFTPAGAGTKTATVSIGCDDPYMNPYTFTITGTVVEESLTLGAWTPGNISPGQVKTYSFPTNPGAVYSIAWDDSYQGSGAYTGDIKVTACWQDNSTAYFSNVNSGYTSGQTITAQGSIVYLKVAGYDTNSNGSFALKVSLCNPIMVVKQGSSNIPNGTGTYNYGNVAPGSSSSISFTIQNTGSGILNLTGSPRVQINGTDAALFSVTTQPASPVAANGNCTFTIQFMPASLGVKTATVTILSNDPDNNAYTFTLTGTGSNNGEELTLGTYLPKTIAAPGAVNTYYFMATPGKNYKIYWDDSYQGSGTYTCDIKVSGYRSNLTTTYFSNIDSGYSTPQTITAQENIVYLKVVGYYSSSYGTFALKVVEI